MTRFIFMKEQHFAYQVSIKTSGLVCTHSAFEADKMLDVLEDIKNAHEKSIFWIFKQLNDEPKEALCIIDCEHQRIYYHYSGDVEALDETIKKLSQLKG